MLYLINMAAFDTISAQMFLLSSSRNSQMRRYVSQVDTDAYNQVALCFLPCRAGFFTGGELRILERFVIMLD